MKVVVPKTGDPWSDIGIVAFFQNLEIIQNEDEELFESLRLTPGFLEFEVEEDYLEDLKAYLIESIKAKINHLLLPPIELKLLAQQEWNKEKESGFIDERYKTPLSNEEITFL
ncbi:hypothetical protein [Marininema halotolerans]|uniref:Uncharacterized protein n=1 Tax=Marininema halotolerans TaxID=1155944 RepID=A0A1I6UT23_9BACL|nr:hypothetical protein [Marininema halotolerans]SFT04556.1 hypothetical protein SAMN05444972_12011 [Marininema halotolerans]